MHSGSADLRAFIYLNAELFPLYRAIMKTFMAERSRFGLHLRSREVFEALNAHRPGIYDVQAVDTALSRLCEWGNLEKHNDTSDVKTVQEFYQPRYLYQLTRAGEEAERVVEQFLEAVFQGGELQAAALEDIRSLLGELLEHARASQPDEAKLYNSFTQLRTRFEELTAKAQTFMSSLQRSIDLVGDETGVKLLQYKEVLIEYLRKFVAELRNSSRQITGKILEIEAEKFESLFDSVARRELVDAIRPTPEAHEKVADEWRQRWRGLRLWFVGEQGAAPRAETLRVKALAAIPVLINAINRLHDRRTSRTDRVADLKALARWFAETDEEAQAHRLWMAAFGLTPARHLSITHETLLEREENPIPPSTSWNEAPPLRISPRLRQTSQYVRKGGASKVIDRSQGKTFLAEQAQKEVQQLEEAKRELTSRGEVRLSSLGSLSNPAFDLFLGLLGDALGQSKAPDQSVEVQSSDGTLLIRLSPTLDGKTAEIATPSGHFLGPDHIIQIYDPDTESARPTEVL